MAKIMLDAGHDINTPGKRSLDGSMREFQFNKAVVLKMVELLKGYENAQVFLSHDLSDGIDTPLKTRTSLANRLGVDVYLSVHANAGPTSARGVETFIFPKAPAHTVRLGDIIHTELARMTKEETLNRGVKRADFQVLRETNMNSVLVECGFMTNASDLAWLKSDSYRNDVAQGLVNGLAIFLGLRKKQVIQKEEVEMLEKAIVIGGFPDFAFAEVLAARLKAPVYVRTALPTGPIAKEVYVVGGSTVGIQGDKVISLTGANRFEVAAAVKNFLG